jgi:hypothetical protein
VLSRGTQVGSTRCILISRSPCCSGRVHAAATCDHSHEISTRLTEYQHDTLFHYDLTLSFFAFIAMSAPKTKPASNGTGPAAKDNAASVPSVPVKAPGSSSSKPDKAVYDAEQQRIKDEIDLLLGKLVRRMSRLCLLTVFITSYV